MVAYITDWFIDSLDPSIQGVPPITREGTLIPKDAADKVRAAAKDSRVSISIRKQD